MATAKFYPRKVLDLAEKNSEGHTFLMFVPDNAASLDKKGKDHHKAVAEDALDEAPEKRAKQNTDFTPVDQIKGIATVTETSSNFIGYASTWVDYFLSKTMESAPPSSFRC